MFFEDNWEEVTAKLPPWAHPPKGKGVTQALRTALIAELAEQRIVSADFKPKSSRSYQALVLKMIEFDSAMAERVVTKVLTNYRRKHSKRYSLD